MWKWFNCYLSGRHDYGMWCENGAIFLRCPHCGKRSNGFSIDAKKQPKKQTMPTVVVSPKAEGRVLPFGRVATR